MPTGCVGARDAHLEPFVAQGNEMHSEILQYNKQQEPHHKEVCDCLAEEINEHLPGADN